MPEAPRAARHHSRIDLWDAVLAAAGRHLLADQRDGVRHLLQEVGRVRHDGAPRMAGPRRGDPLVDRRRFLRRLDAQRIRLALATIGRRRSQVDDGRVAGELGLEGRSDLGPER